MDLSVFGDIKENNKLLDYCCWTNEEEIKAGDTVFITNFNCEFDYDAVTGRFTDNPLYAFIVDLKIINADFSIYDRDKSNNGGCYAFAECEVLKVHEKTY